MLKRVVADTLTQFTEIGKLCATSRTWHLCTFHCNLSWSAIYLTLSLIGQANIICIYLTNWLVALRSLNLTYQWVPRMEHILIVLFFIMNKCFVCFAFCVSPSNCLSQVWSVVRIIIIWWKPLWRICILKSVPTKEKYLLVFSSPTGHAANFFESETELIRFDW